MDNQITDRKFWQEYWRSKSNLDFIVQRNYTFNRLLKDLIQVNKIRTAIELGGFPGYYAIFLKKYFNISTTLFDFFVDEPILNKVLDKNSLSRKDVAVIESDLFTYSPENHYDLVLSCGLIEHFQDTEDMIVRHLRFLRPGGVLFITLPNFVGFNGWIQRVFDIENLEKHNLKSMDIAMLNSICKELGLREVKVFYYGKFNVWLENKSTQPFPVKLFVKTIWFVGKALSVFLPFESKMFSPYIVLTAKG